MAAWSPPRATEQATAAPSRRVRRSRATAPTTTTARSIVAVLRAGGDRRHGTEQDQIATVGAAQAAHAGPHQSGSGGEGQPIVEPAREVRVPLRDEGDDRRRGEADAAHPTGQLGRQQVREHDTSSGEGQVGEAHQQQAAVRTVSGLGEPDQRGDRDVVERRVIGHPHSAVPAVPSGPPLDLPLRGALRNDWLALDLGQPEVGDLVGVAEVRLLVGVVERRLLEGEHRRDPDERDHDSDEADHGDVNPPPGCQRPDGALVVVGGATRFGRCRRPGDQLGGADRTTVATQWRVVLVGQMFTGRWRRVPRRRRHRRRRVRPPSGGARPTLLAPRRRPPCTPLGPGRRWRRRRPRGPACP